MKYEDLYYRIRIDNIIDSHLILGTRTRGQSASSEEEVNEPFLHAVMV